jgi:hypothetical protein
MLVSFGKHYIKIYSNIPLLLEVRIRIMDLDNIWNAPGQVRGHPTKLPEVVGWIQRVKLN